VISTATNTVTDTIKGFSAPTGIAISSAGTTVWVGNMGSTTVSIVDPATNTITGSISGFPGGSWGLSESTSYYDFIGFDAPVGPQPEISQANAGQAIPMQFTLVGDPGTDIFNAGYPAAQQVDCSTGGPVNSSTLTDAATAAAGDSGLQDDSGSYTFVWKTSKAWAGTCQEFILGLSDGSTHTATFQFK
jgi:YVTN family beta-propeller protein